MDQTPLPFVLDDNRTYDTVGAKEIWVRSGQSGLDKRQCTVQLTVFGDGVCRLRPTLIVRGKGLRIPKEEKSNWDKRVKVSFQEKAWCDQTIMKCWINEEWGNMFFNPATPESSGKILCADLHRAQQTATVKRMLQSKNTVLVNIPHGCTSKVQPLDVSINKPFKDYLRTQFEKNRDENIELYISNKLTASKTQVLKTKWVAEAWEKIKAKKEMIICSFTKCGITTNEDGSENHLVHIEGISCVMSQSEDEFHLEMSSDEDSDNSLSSTYHAMSLSDEANEPAFES